MADTRPDRLVPIVLGRPRKLRFNHFAVAEFEDVAKIDLVDLIRDPKKLLSVRVQVYLLWAGLIHADQLLTPQDVAGLLDQLVESGGDKGPIFQAVTEALQASEVFANAKAAVAEVDPKVLAAQAGQPGAVALDVASTVVALPSSPAAP